MVPRKDTRLFQPCSITKVRLPFTGSPLACAGNPDSIFEVHELDADG